MCQFNEHLTAKQIANKLNTNIGNIYSKIKRMRSNGVVDSVEKIINVGRQSESAYKVTNEWRE